MTRAARVVVAALLLATACSGGVRSVTGGSVSAPVLAVPSQVLGLVVAQESVAEQLEEVERPYVDSVAMFSLRENDLLRATLQLSRFNRLARPGSAEFRAQVIGLLGASRPLRIRVGDTEVWSTSGNQQNVFVWFDGRGMFVLSVHLDYTLPRTLLRRLVNLEVKL